LNASSTLSSFAAGDLVQFNSSCFLFIDGFMDTIGKIGDAGKGFLSDAWDNVKEHPFSTIGGVLNAPATLLVKAGQYALGDEQQKEEAKKEALAAVEGNVAYTAALAAVYNPNLGAGAVAGVIP
jgi:hypothetical protein